MSTSELLAECDELADVSHDIAVESSQIVAGWQRVDNLRVKEMIQSMYHMSWSLKDIADNIVEITGNKYTAPKSTLEQLRYDDHEQLDSIMLAERTRDWYDRVKQFQLVLTSILQQVEAMGANPKVVRIMCFRLGFDLEFFERQASAILQDRS